MQWEKVKTIFIYVFFFVNAFLIYTQLSNQTNEYALDDSVVENIVTILNQSGVDIDSAVIPKRQPPIMQYDVVSNSTVKQYADDCLEKLHSLKEVSQAEVAAAEGVSFQINAIADKVSDKKSANRIAYKIADAITRYTPTLRQSLDEDNGYNFIFGISLDGVFVLDQYLSVRIYSDNRIEIAGENWLDDVYVKKIQSKPFGVHTVLADFPKHVDAEGSTITAVELGYTLGQRDSASRTQLAPTWKVSTMDNDYYFAASDI